MKHERIGLWYAASVLGFFTAWGAVFCLVSAFDLALGNPRLLVLLWGIAAAAAALLLTIPRGGTVLLCLLALGLGYLYQDGTAIRQLWQLCHYLSTIYDQAYACGVLILPEGLGPGTVFDWPLGLWGVLIAASVCQSVCRRTSVWLPMAITLVPLTSCIVVTNTVPGEVWLMMVMAGLILLLLTAPVRQENGVQGLRLMAMAVLPVLIALTVLFLAIPQEGYVNHSAVFRENVLTAVQYFPQLLEGGAEEISTSFQGKERKSLDLAHLGPRIPFTYPVLDVTAPSSGRLYLRRQDFDSYNGTSWTSTDARQEVFSSPGGAEEVITISTRTGQDLQLLTYYPAEAVTLRDGCLENPDRQREYTLRRTPLPEHQIQADAPPPEYLALPDKTRQDAAGLLEGRYAASIPTAQKADIIAELVMAAAAYDLNPSLMPADAPDFALWFLTEGERGYCVHFATAAVVLLRTADIPARYVTGYMTETFANETVTVTEAQAHAWAEYFDQERNIWVPLEATPAAEAVPETVPTEPAAQPTEATAQTQPEAAQPPAASTLPAALERPTPPPDPAPAPKAALPLGQLALGLLAMLTMAGQRALRLKLRRRRQRTGTSNQQALRRWQESLRLSRLLKEIPTEELMGLAQKAKFSQHELTAEELLEFDSFNRSCLRRLKQKPWYLRLIYKYLCAAY